MSQFIVKSKQQVERFVAREEGAMVVQYGLLIALLAVFCIVQPY